MQSLTLVVLDAKHTCMQSILCQRTCKKPMQCSVKLPLVRAFQFNFANQASARVASAGSAPHAEVVASTPAAAALLNAASPLRLSTSAPSLLYFTLQVRRAEALYRLCSTLLAQKGQSCNSHCSCVSATTLAAEFCYCTLHLSTWLCGEYTATALQGAAGNIVSDAPVSALSAALQSSVAA